MNYRDFLDDPELNGYFGGRKDKWIPELKTIVDKSGIADSELDDKDAENKLLQTQKFSWLGFFVGLYWYAYHGSLYWLHVVVAFTIIRFIDLLMFDMKFSSYISLGFAFTIGFFGKSYMFASKVREFSVSGKISPPSWGRVGVAFALTFSPAILIFLGL